MYANQLKAKTTVGLNEKRVNIHKVKKKKKKQFRYKCLPTKENTFTNHRRLLQPEFNQYF